MAAIGPPDISTPLTDRDDVFLRPDETAGLNIAGGLGNDRIRTGTGNDRLFGGEGTDTLIGDVGDDILTGGPGRDLLSGGLGADIASYMDSPAPVRVTLAAGRGFGGDAEGDQLVGIDGLFGSAFADRLVGDDRDNVLVGMGGGDTLIGGGGDDNLGEIEGMDAPNTLFGGAGDDELFLESAGSEAYGGAGNDIVASIIGDGGHTLFGGAGNDTVAGDNFGDDTVFGGAGDDLMGAGPGNDTVFGGAGNDQIFFQGGPGTSTVYGGAGDDFIADPDASGADGAQAFGNAGNDTFEFEVSGDDETSGFELFGGTGDDLFILNGTTDSTLIGGAGDDVFDIWGGGNVVAGNAGADTFRLDLGTVTIRDFSDEDVIDLTATAPNGSPVTFADLTITSVAGGNATLITAEGPDPCGSDDDFTILSIRLNRVDASTVTEDDFLFA